MRSISAVQLQPTSCAFTDTGDNLLIVILHGIARAAVV